MLGGTPGHGGIALHGWAAAGRGGGTARGVSRCDRDRAGGGSASPSRGPRRPHGVDPWSPAPPAPTWGPRRLRGRWSPASREEDGHVPSDESALSHPLLQTSPSLSRAGKSLETPPRPSCGTREIPTSPEPPTEPFQRGLEGERAALSPRAEPPTLLFHPSSLRCLRPGCSSPGAAPARPALPAAGLRPPRPPALRVQRGENPGGESAAVGVTLATPGEQEITLAGPAES